MMFTRKPSMSGYFDKSVWMCLAMGVAAQVGAQSLPQPLVEATKQAVLSSPDVQEKWKAFQAATHGVPMARAGWMPKVDLTASAGQQDGKTAGGTRYGWNSISATEISLSQLLFDGGIASSAIRGAEGERLRAFYAMTEASESVALEVFKAYADLLRYRETVAAATENYAEHKRTYDMLDERVRAKVARGADLEQAGARLAKSETALVSESINLHNAGTRYLRMVGTVAPSKLPEWPEETGLVQLPPTAQEVLQKGLAQNPALQAALTNWRNTEEAVLGKRKAVYMPRVEARVSSTESRNLNGVLGSDGKNVAELVLQQNIYRGGFDSATQVGAEEAAKRARDQLEQTCRVVRETLSVAYKDVATLKTQMRLADVHRLASDKSRTAYRQQFDIGQRTLLDLLDTQNEWFDTSRQFTNVRFDQLIAQARTLASMGRLVATVGAGRADWPSASDAGQAEGATDVSAYCPAQTTFMDDLERYKVVPEVQRKQSYVVLLPDADGSVGSVTVRGPGGEQVISQAQFGAPISGRAAPVAVADADVQKDFAAALKAQPILPEKFTLLFERGSTRLTPASQAGWAQLLQRMKTRPTVDITVAGHADTVSSSQVNDALALKRAQFVANKLRASGYKTVEILVESHGKNQLAVPTPDQTDEPRNRRAVVSVR